MFEREIKWRVDSLQTVRVDTRYSLASQAIIPPTESYDITIAATIVRVAHRKDSVSLPPEHIQLVKSLFRFPKPVIIACFGSPYLIDKFPHAPTWIASFSTADVSQRAAARALFGENAIRGKIPVSVPTAEPKIKIGDGIAKSASSSEIAYRQQGSRNYNSLRRTICSNGTRLTARSPAVFSQSVTKMNSRFIHSAAKHTNRVLAL